MKFQNQTGTHKQMDSGIAISNMPPKDGGINKFKLLKITLNYGFTEDS